MRDYSIDTLRRPDGTFATPTPRIIAGALRCGHTAHLQTGRGTVAIRPYNLEPCHFEGERGRQRRERWPTDRVGLNWLLEFYPSHESLRPCEYRGNDMELAMEFVYRQLTGEDHAFEAGVDVDWYANQATREATVLAVLDDELVLEYEMPGTTAKWGRMPAKPTSALVICQIYAVNKLRQIRSVPHRKLPKYWLKAIAEQGAADFWIGAGQRELHPVEFSSIYSGEIA